MDSHVTGILPDLKPGQDKRRDTIVREARRFFMSQGYASTRIEPIARAACVSTATLYAYFPSKEHLFGAVIEDATEDFSRQMECVRLSDGPAREMLTGFALTYARFMGDPFVRAVFRLVMAERPRFRDVALRFFDKGRSDFGRPLIQALQTLADRGEIRFDKASWAAGQLMGMVEHPVFFMPLVTGDEVQAERSPEKIASDAVETFLARYGT
ncbi:TetR family transcriptional regulator [Brevundimonas sp. AAP58]|uniref:TetR/AcrR family transcriptional regulator n=1 Tax=Brevundimonas sp. AAP58 TaxID=1523422 RepID=UPI0006B890BF|nr:TetR/AcrR family transcriptional regulator [Brevundimonas sp. AAP58]KPF84541.1 TetR family transcriptional regulator [Brevundimonas sp. AAP58]